MRVRCDIERPPQQGASWEERWEGPDRGLICCWLRGIEKALERPDLADAARAGALPILSWKGGVARAVKSGRKVGATQYLATWQGLRGDSLDVDTDRPVQLTCTATGVTVTYTMDTALLLAEETEREET